MVSCRIYRCRNAKKYEIVAAGSYHKFSQHAEMRQLLLELETG